MNKRLLIGLLLLGGCASQQRREDPVDMAMDYCADHRFNDECNRRLIKALSKAAQVDDSPNYMSGFTQTYFPSEIIVIQK